MATSALLRPLISITVLACLAGSPGAALAQSTGAPSAFCHVTDGQFTACSGGGLEWSDVPVQSFPEAQSFVYASQADLDPVAGSPFSPLDTFVLMYDECERTAPLASNHYFRVAFKTVEVDEGVEKIEHYVLFLFTDATIVFIEDGVVQPPGRAPVVDGMRGAVGFGPSPNCPVDHVIAEFEVPLSITGSSYSPDPLFWSASAPPPPPRECEPGDITISALVNVLDGASISDAAIQDMVDESNLIMQQAGVCSQFSAANIVRDVSDQGNDDGMVTPLEYRSLEIVCSRELGNRNRPGFGPGKGIKVFMGNELSTGPNTEGENLCDVSPCIYLRTDALFPLGFVLAHEMGHAFGMCPGVSVGTDVLDEGGHLEAPGNLMEPGPTSIGGSELTAEQIEIIRSGAVRRSSNTEHGGWEDALGDVSRQHIDLTVGTLFAADLASDLEITIRTAGSHPVTPVTSRFELLFDTDNNSATGVTVGSHSGIEKVVEVTLAGEFPFTPPAGSTTARLRDVTAGTSVPLLAGRVVRSQLIADVFSGPASPGTSTVGDVIEQSVPLPALGLTATTVPVVVMATDVASMETDEAAFVFTMSLTPGLRAIRPGFDAASLAANDDGSTALVPLGFTANFFGTPFTGLFVNNNGNLTFDAALREFTPFGLTATTRKIIAPFFADVDTRAGNVVTYGAGIVSGRPAFGANWPGVGCFSRQTSVLNFFQVLLVDRSDIGAGDFDIEFNYDAIQWETGQASGGSTLCRGGDSARVGFSSGTGIPGTFFELTGSGVPGAFLDINAQTGLVHNSLNSAQPGRYIFAVRNGVPVVDDGDGDGVADAFDNCPAIENPDQRDGDLNGIGDACQTPGLLHSTSAFMQAGFDGSTLVEPRSLLVAEEPGLLEQLTRIVEFRLDAGLTTSAAATTSNLVSSLVALNVVPPDEAGALVDAVLGGITQPLRGDIDRDGDVDRADIDILVQHRNTTVGNSTCGLTCDLDGDGTITTLDARIVVTLCTRPRCATQ